MKKKKKRIVDSGNIVLLGRVNGSLAVARAFGDFRYKKSKEKTLLPEETAVTVIPEIKKEIFIKEDNKTNFLVLACDGVWDVMKNEDVCNFIKEKLDEQKKKEDFKEFDLGEICESMLTRCIKELDSTDNCTVIIVLIK